MNEENKRDRVVGTTQHISNHPSTSSRKRWTKKLKADRVLLITSRTKCDNGGGDIVYGTERTSKSYINNRRHDFLDCHSI